MEIIASFLIIFSLAMIGVTAISLVVVGSLITYGIADWWRERRALYHHAMSLVNTEKVAS